MNPKKIQSYKNSEEGLLQLYNVRREEHFIDIPARNIKVRVQSLGEGKPLLFLHGGPNAGSTWLQLASLLGDFQCLLLDRPGCGLSDSVSYKGITKERLIPLVIEVFDSVLDYYKLDKISVVASSFGAYWSMLYALERPGRIEKLILEGCPALVEQSPIPPFMKNASHPIGKLMMKLMPSTNAYSKKIMKEIGHTHSIDKGIISEQFIDWYVDLCNYTDTLKNDMAAIAIATKGGRANPEFILRDSEISQLDTKTLWLWGKEDAFGGMEMGNRLHSLVKESRIIFYDDSGHLPWLDQPAEHAETIRAFVL